MIDGSRQEMQENSRERNDLVTEELFGQLRQFRRTHAYKDVDIAGVGWRYVRSGRGEETILLLPGAPGICETSFQQILMLERSYCILSVIYPSSATTMVQVTSGLQGILTAENIGQVHVIGISYGGAIAQCLLRQMPERIGKLVFTCTGIPNKKTARKYKIYRNVLSLLPSKWIHTLLLCGKPRFLSGLTVQRSFWSAYYDQMIPSLSKEDYLTRMQVWIDFHQNCTLFYEKIFQQYGKILIIEAENDTVFPIEEQKLLEARYPRAQIYKFLQATHMAAISKTDEYLDVITRFFHTRAGAEEGTCKC